MASKTAIPYRKLTPATAWNEALARSMVIGVSAWVVLRCLQAGGTMSPSPRLWLVLGSGLVSAFLAALAWFVAYYHARWTIGVLGATLSLVLPYSVSLLWVRFSSRSLAYPVLLIALLGLIALWAAHYRTSGPRWGDDIAEAAIQRMLEEFKPTWLHRIVAICLVTAVVLLLILMLR